MSKSLYVMKSGNQYKIGVAEIPEARLLSLRTGNPKIELIYASRKIKNAYAVETRLHRELNEFCIGREWFSNCREDQLIYAVRDAVESIGLDVDEDETVTIEIGKEAEMLFDWMLQEKSKQIETVSREVDKINQENKELMAELIRLGWTNEQIEKNINDAVKTVCNTGY